jgi:hypothetical protein
MNSYRSLSTALSVLIATACGLAVQAEERNPSPKDRIAFGLLQAPRAEEVRAQAEAWLKAMGKTDAETRTAFDAIWAVDRPLLDRVAATLELGDSEARTLLAEARDPNAPAPQAVPAAVQNAKQSAFYRANLALAYAKELSNRRVYEEGLAVLKTVKPEQVVDPSSYLFYRAVAEHALLLKNEADDTILRLLDDVVDAPERHKMVAALMHFEMRQWRDKDLGWVTRKMGTIERRLDLSRGGPKTQRIQKEVVMRLDEIIKQLEKDCDCNGGNCPNGGNGNKPSNNVRSRNPQNDSNPGNGTGPGTVDPKRFKEVAQNWGNLPPKEREKAMIELTKDLPPRQREVIETYFKKLASSN